MSHTHTLNSANNLRLVFFEIQKHRCSDINQLFDRLAVYGTLNFYWNPLKVIRFYLHSHRIFDCINRFHRIRTKFAWMMFCAFSIHSMFRFFLFSLFLMAWVYWTFEQNVWHALTSSKCINYMWAFFSTIIAEKNVSSSIANDHHHIHHFIQMEWH